MLIAWRERDRKGEAENAIQLMEKVSKGEGKKWNPGGGGPGLGEGETSLS